MTELMLNEAVETLKKGLVPQNLTEVSADAMKTLFEMRELMAALIECVQRQGNTIKTIRTVNDALQKQLKERRGG